MGADRGKQLQACQLGSSSAASTVTKSLAVTQEIFAQAWHQANVCLAGGEAGISLEAYLSLPLGTHIPRRPPDLL